MPTKSCGISCKHFTIVNSQFTCVISAQLVTLEHLSCK